MIGPHEVRGALASAGRLGRTLAHLHPFQLALRPVHVARLGLFSRVPGVARFVAGAPSAKPGPRVIELAGPFPAGLPGVSRELERAALALDGKVEFVGRTLALTPPSTDFMVPDEPRLVQYQLGYLEVVRSLAIAAHVEGFGRRDEAVRLAVSHARELVDRVPPGAGAAWEPYVVAMRILNLVAAADLLRPLASSTDRAFLDDELPRAIASHARWLLVSLEGHLLGNHLFTDGAALFVAGCALDADGSALWRRVGGAIVARSVANDVLADGGHDERSPTYAAIYLDQLSYVLASARAAKVEAPAGSKAAAARMARFVGAIAHPDGELPLFGDSAFGESATADDLGSVFGLSPDGLRRRLYGACGESEPIEGELRLFPETGVAVVQAGGERLAIDAGPLGSRHQPGHAHSDALTFELSHRGRRLVVDGGAGHYQDDEARAYFRGPFAHSSVSVDGEGPDEIWASFRAGGRGRVDVLDTQRAGAIHLVRGRVKSCRGWTHERLFIYAPGHLLAVFDHLQDAPRGATALSHLLLAHDVLVGDEDADGARTLRTADGAQVSLQRLFGGDRFRLRRGEESPRRGFHSWRMGRFLPATALELELSTLGNERGAAWAMVLGTASVARESPSAFVLRAGSDAVRVTLEPDGKRWWAARL